MPAFPPMHPPVLPTKPPSRSALEDISMSLWWWKKKKTAAKPRWWKNGSTPPKACYLTEALTSLRSPSALSEASTSRSRCLGSRGAEELAGAEWEPGSSSLAPSPHQKPWGLVSEEQPPIPQSPILAKLPGLLAGQAVFPPWLKLLGLLRPPLELGCGKSFPLNSWRPSAKVLLQHWALAEQYLLRSMELGDGGSFGSNLGSVVELKKLRSPPNQNGTYSLRGTKISSVVEEQVEYQAEYEVLQGQCYSTGAASVVPGAPEVKGRATIGCSLWLVISLNKTMILTAFFQTSQSALLASLFLQRHPPGLCRVPLHHATGLLKSVSKDSQRRQFHHFPQPLIPEWSNHQWGIVLAWHIVFSSWPNSWQVKKTFNELKDWRRTLVLIQHIVWDGQSKH